MTAPDRDDPAYDEWLDAQEAARDAWLEWQEAEFTFAIESAPPSEME